MLVGGVSVWLFGLRESRGVVVCDTGKIELALARVDGGVVFVKWGGGCRNIWDILIQDSAIHRCNKALLSNIALHNDPGVC